MKYETRQYQVDAANALWEAIQTPGKLPVIAVPTGAGKTVIMGLFFERYIKEYPDNQILVLSHTQDILEQDAESLQNFFPDRHIALYSAGLGRKEHDQITVGGIQSVIKNPDLFRWTNLVMVDEVHSVNHAKVGSYRKLLDNMHAQIIGMSATVFRSGHGYIYKGKNTLFNHLAYDLTSIANFNKLVEDGYLCKLISVEPDTQLDSSRVKKSGGDYNVKALSNAHDQDGITRAAIKEAKHYGRNYKKWLVFAIDIEHANNICRSLNRNGILSRVLHSRITADRTTVIDSFKQGNVRALVSVGMITTGFDAPNVDLILMLRPTMSAVLHVQMIGRGLRIHPGKKHCLVLDYSGNTSRLGPINNVLVPKEVKKGGGEAPTKTCPKCKTITYPRAKFCESCNHEFIFESKLTTTSSKEAIVEEGKFPPSKERWLTVERALYNIHRKPNSPAILMVTYHCGLQRIKEYLCLDHNGYAGRKAAHIVGYRGYQGDLTTIDVYRNRRSLKVPKQILVDFSSKYPQIQNSKF